MLSIYHFILYFQQKDKVYLYYSFYTFLIFSSNLTDSLTGFIPNLIQPISKYLTILDNPLMWLYNTIYFVFGFTFIDLKSYSKKWYKIIFTTVNALLIVIVGVVLISIMTNNQELISRFNTIIVPFFLVFGVICYYPLFIIKMPLKNYIIIGSLILFFSSLIGFYINKTGLLATDSNLGFSIFYFGIIVENIIFSLGLGQKQKQILQEKNDTQKVLINQLKENEQLRKTIHKQLEKDVISISEKAESEKLEKLKVAYEKELVELKMTSLRTQMNPHFIFNSLNAIKLYIIDNEKENAVYYLNKFSKLIRKILATTQQKDITLVDEIETMKLYLNIENIRFNNEIEYVFNVDQNINLNTIKIPALILQPFIENAIWHGLSPKKKNKKIIINIKMKTKNFVLISIIDNGIGRKRAAEIKKKKTLKKNSIGIKLTQERLNHFFKKYENKYRLSFKDLFNDDNKPIGTEINLKIPVK